MDALRKKFFARAGFALNNDATGGSGVLPGLGNGLLHGRTGVNNV